MGRACHLVDAIKLLLYTAASQTALPPPCRELPDSRGPGPWVGFLLPPLRPGLFCVHCVPSIQYGPSHEKDGTCLGSAVVRTQRSLHWAQFQSLVGKLRSYRPCTPNVQWAPHQKTNTEGAQSWL